VLTVETSAREATTAQDGTTLHIKVAEDWATLAETEALEWVSRVEVGNSAALACAHDDAKGLAQKIALLESELAEEHQAHETSEREHRECFDELILLWTQDLELCLAIVSPPRARCMSDGMRLATLHHNEMVWELAAFQVAVSSITESMLGSSPNSIAHAEVVGELVAELHWV
jgi:hypothetical protein